MAQHVKILGVLHIILGCFGVLAAIIVFAVFGGLAGFFWALLQPQTEALFTGRPLPPAYPVQPGPPRV